jgi:hypothetical protein
MNNLDLISLEEGMLPPVSPLGPKTKTISQHFKNTSSGGKYSKKMRRTKIRKSRLRSKKSQKRH